MLVLIEMVGSPRLIRHRKHEVMLRVHIVCAHIPSAAGRLRASSVQAVHWSGRTELLIVNPAVPSMPCETGLNIVIQSKSGAAPFTH